MYHSILFHFLSVGLAVLLLCGGTLFPVSANSLIPTRLTDTQISTYDALDRVISATRPDTATRTYTWNRRNRLSAFEEPGGQDWSLDYDGNGNLSAITDPLQREHRYERDAEDRVQALKTVVDGTERVTALDYDAEGRVIKVTDPENVSAAYEYDAEGRLQHSYDAQNRLTATFGYDARGNHAFSTDALGRTAALRYDGLDRLTELEDPLQRVTELDYDEANRLRGGRLVSGDPLTGGHSTQTFDSRDRLLTREGPPATVTASGFSAAAAVPEEGNVFSTVPSDTGDRFTYYSNGLLKEERNSGVLVAKWTYNSCGLPDAMLNGRLQKRTFEWDENGRLKSFTDPDGTVEYAYDINGNTLSSKRGSALLKIQPDPLTTQSADSTKGIKRRAAADTANSGRLLRSAAAGDTEEPVDVSRTYDDLHRVTSYTNPANEIIGYEYDGAGNLHKLKYPGNKTVTYTYDKAGRLKTVTDWAQRKTVYHYDANGRLEKTERPNGTVQKRVYNAAGQLTLLEDLDVWNNVIVRYRYFYNAAGEIVRESMEPENAVFSLSLPLTMAYGDYNRLALWNGQDVQFDADNNLTYGPLGSGFADFEYDSRNRLTKAGDIGYIYDSEDTRVAAVDNGQRTAYTVDPNSTLSRLLVKTDPDGNKTFYVYGLGLIGDASGVQYTTYHFDLRGSTVALTDLNGGVTERFRYSPYGVLMSGDASRTPFLFNGMYGVMSDANGLYYMRARFYHPQLRRFLNADLVRGSVAQGQGINRFGFVMGSPIDYVDPLGLSRLGPPTSRPTNRGRYRTYQETIEEIISNARAEILIREIREYNPQFTYVTVSSVGRGYRRNDVEYLQRTLQQYKTGGVCHIGSAREPIQRDIESHSSSAYKPRKFENLYKNDPVHLAIPQYQLLYRNGKWITVNPATGVTRTASGFYLFIRQDNNIWVMRDSRNRGGVGHIDLAGGMPVEYAGGIQFSGRGNRGKIRYWNNGSGHYKPGFEFSGQAGLPQWFFRPAELE